MSRVALELVPEHAQESAQDRGTIVGTGRECLVPLRVLHRDRRPGATRTTDDRALRRVVEEELLVDLLSQQRVPATTVTRAPSINGNLPITRCRRLTSTSPDARLV